MGNLDRASAELAPGEIFADRYRIESLLGRGGMGAVYRAHDQALGEAIALKVMLLDEEPSAHAVVRFRQEVRLARKVTHPNVARVYDLGEAGGALYLTMELVDGPTLRSLLRAEGRLGPARSVRIGRALCAGLGAAHAAGVIHRDLKPPNVLLDGAGRVVITDFGIARSLNDGPGLTLGVVGTPTYMAPEQASSGPVDERTDLFTLGLLLFEMVTGAHAEGGPETLAEALAREGAPPGLAAVVLRCLARDPEGRPRSADEVSRALADALPGGEAAHDDERTALAIPVGSAPLTVPSLPPGTGARTSLSLGGGRAAVDRALAVLPFRYRGPPEQDYLGEAISDELGDVLSRTRGLRVLGSGATSRFREARDPLQIGKELSVHAVVDGAVQLAGERVRITARLLDADSGVQLWSEHHEGTLADLFALQESIARRVAEELRVEITTLTYGGDSPPEAIELYLASRRRLRSIDYASVTTAAAGFERVILLAPRFGPAIAAHAVACLRAWFLEFGSGGPVDWEKAAQSAVDRALSQAPEIAESHLAAGIRAAQYGDYPASARALHRALAIAPTCAEAHEYLGMLQCEAGQPEEGVGRLALASELDPTLTYCLVFIARHHALHGRFPECDAALDELQHRRGTHVFSAAALRVRAGAWRGDLEEVRRRGSDAERLENPAAPVVSTYVQAFLGDLDGDEVERRFGSILAVAQNPRYLELATQLLTEIHGAAGRVEAGMMHLERAATSILVDVEWLDRCPLLAPLRGEPGYAEARRRVAARAAGIWAV